MRGPLLIVVFVGCLYSTSAYAASSKDTILHTSYARASTYRTPDADVSTTRTDAESATECSGRDCSKGAGGSVSKPRRANRDTEDRPRWHSMLPGMIR